MIISFFAAKRIRRRMAEIIPFRALHYNPEKAGDLARLVTQPYDKITAEMQARYHAASPFNLAHVIRGLDEAGDAPDSNVYTRAARTFYDWIESRVLTVEAEPALYAYDQEFRLPADPDVAKRRRGFIALCRLEPYAARVVCRHEETLAGPKRDRLELLKHARAHFGQIFMLYSDPAGEIEAALAASTGGRPWQEVEDEYATRHTVWRVADPRIIERVAQAMRERQLLIADGHHRYETALAYREIRRAQSAEDVRADYVMVTLVRLESDGLAVLPTHRVLHSLEGFEPGRLLADARRYFDSQELEASSASALVERLERAGRDRPAIGVYTGGGRFALLRPRRDLRLASELGDVPESLARLDVVLLHRLLLERVLGVGAEAVREQKNLRYVREAPEALKEVDEGAAQVSFLLNATPVRGVWENALAGRVLPQKSTDFYPKLLSGLTVYWLDHPAGI
jgi:uncharacterized protein (DUF1015 family)